jgi:hypothetical protein
MASASVSRGGGNAPIARHSQEVEEGVGGARALLEMEKGGDVMGRHPF